MARTIRELMLLKLCTHEAVVKMNLSSTITAPQNKDNGTKNLNWA